MYPLFHNDRYCDIGIDIIWNRSSSAIRFNKTPSPIIAHVIHQAQGGIPLPSFFTLYASLSNVIGHSSGLLPVPVPVHRLVLLPGACPGSVFPQSAYAKQYVFHGVPPIPFSSFCFFSVIPAFFWPHRRRNRYSVCFSVVCRSLHTASDRWRHAPPPVFLCPAACAPFPISPAAFARRRRKIQRCIYHQTMSRTLHRPFSRFLCPALAVGPGVPCGRLFYPVFRPYGIFPVYPLG